MHLRGLVERGEPQPSKHDWQCQINGLSSTSRRSHGVHLTHTAFCSNIYAPFPIHKEETLHISLADLSES